MHHNVVSDQGLQCLPKGFSIKNRTKGTKGPDTLKMTNGLIQHITVEESTCIQWVNMPKKLRAKFLSANLTLKAPIMTAADDMHKFINIFSLFFRENKT